MAKTVASIITAARSYHKRNRANKTALDSELIREIDYAHRLILTRHPNRFTEETAVAGGAGRTAWVLPAAAAGRVVGIFKTDDGSFIEFAPYRDKDALVGAGVYYAGQRFYPGTGDLDPDPTTDSLTFIHGIVPAPLTASGEIHENFPPEYEQMLILKAAGYFAGKDGRMSDVMRHDDDYMDMLAQLDATSQLWGEHGYRSDGSNPSYGGAAVYRP